MVEPEIISIFSHTETIAVLCSSAVSIIAVIATVHQTKIQKETELSKIYYDNQVMIYSELYESAVNFDTLSPTQETYNRLLIACQQAKLISSAETALIIDDFCKFCEEHFHKPNRNTEYIGQEFSNVRKRLENALREELYCYRPKRISTKLRSIFRGLLLKKLSK